MKLLSASTRRNLLAVAAVASISGFTQAQSAADLDQITQAELVAKAEAEGKVVIYAFTSRIARVEKAFEAKYPKIDVVTFDINSTQMIARLKSEQAAKISNADVAYISDIPVVVEELVKPGIMQRYVPAMFASKVPADLQNPLLANRLSTKVWMYSEEAYPNGSPIKNIWQTTLPEWRGKVVMVDPLVRGDYLDFMTEIVLRSDEMAQAYQKQFGKPIALTGRETAGEKWI